MKRSPIAWNWALAWALAAAFWSAGVWRIRLESPRPWSDPTWPEARGVYRNMPRTGMNEEDWAILASPTLFALPSELGFSRLPPGHSPISPPVESSVPEPPFLPRAPWRWSLTPESLVGSLAVVAEPPVELPPRAIPNTSVLTWVVVDGPSSMHGSTVAGPWRSACARPRPWSVDLRVRVSAEGWPVQVSVESGDVPTEDREALTRELAQWRWAPSATGSEVRVRATFAPLISAQEDLP